MSFPNLLSCEHCSCLCCPAPRSRGLGRHCPCDSLAQILRFARKRSGSTGVGFWDENTWMETASKIEARNKLSRGFVSEVR
jgi:hypothetical protein